MKLLIMLFVSVVLCFGAPQKDATKETGKPQTKNQAVAVAAPVSVFESTVTVLKKQLSEIEKSKEEQKLNQAKIEKEAVSLATKYDSVYNVSKLTLKSIYDKELARVMVQYDAINAAKDKLEQDYQAALKAIEDSKSTKK